MLKQTKHMNMTFGGAIEALINGHKVARSCWNGKKMFLKLAGGILSINDVKEQGNPAFEKDAHLYIDGVSCDLFMTVSDAEQTEMPYIWMHTATGKRVNGWLASQTDMLAEDWQIVE